MTYRVVLIESREGYAAACPALPGCWSQGDTVSEALEYIADAIRELLDAGGVAAVDGGEAEEAEIKREAAKENLNVSVHEVRLPVTA